MKRYLLPVFLLLLVPCVAFGGVTFSDDFDGYADSPANHGWSVGSAVSVVDNGCRSGRCVKIAYTAEGTAAYIFQRTISTPELWVRFYFKMSSHANPGGGGFKFLKLFGYRTGTNYANVTVGHPRYEDGRMPGVYAGDTTGLTNDASALYRFAGTTTGAPVAPTILSSEGEYDTPANQDVWHSFEAHVKFSTDSTADGEFQIWIDGADYYHATGVINRNDANVRNFITLAFGDYGRGGSFDIYYDDIAYGDAYIGVVSSADPDSFTFTDVTGAALSTPTDSTNTVTFAGTDNTFDISISGTGCTYCKNAEACTAVAGTAVAGDNVFLRGTSSGSYATTSPSCTFVAGGVTDSDAPWIVTTLAAVADPVAPRQRGGGRFRGR